MQSVEDPVKNPTWMTDIRFFFTPEDITHMGRLGIDLATYEGVKANALRILGATEPPDATMPPDTSRQWSQARVISGSSSSPSGRTPWAKPSRFLQPATRRSRATPAGVKLDVDRQSSRE